MKRAVRDYVRDILDEMDRVERFVEGMSRESLNDDELRLYAVSKAFENMGEAAKHVPEALCVRYPEVMWREMAEMRGRTVHAYWGMELRFGWLSKSAFRSSGQPSTGSSRS